MARQPRRGGNSPTSLGTDNPELEAAKDRDTAIIDEAKYRFDRAWEWEGEQRQLAVADTKFANGDSDNNWQWPDGIRKDRDIMRRPCLTINKTKMHVLMLANEARQNPPSAKVKPVGEKVSYEAAEVWEGILRHIEYLSDAQSVYTHAKQDQLEGGIGYWHVKPDYEDDRSFDQELHIEPLEAQRALLDCDIKRVDGSDAMWGFIFDDYDRKEFRKLFPNVDLPVAASTGTLANRDTWIRRDAVRVAQYYRIQLTEEELIYLEDDGGTSWTGLRKDIAAGLRDDLPLYERGEKGRDFKKRTVMERTLQWFKIAGNEITDRRDGSSKDCANLKGRYIPIVRMPGRERTIENKLYRAGLVRGIKDAQRMYNYNTSGEVEVVALQTKTPWIVAAEAIEGNESAWRNANTTNAAYLTYRALADDGETLLPKPERMQAPQPAQGFLEGLRIAAAEMEMASGQYSGQMQAEKQTQERTPAAVDQRQRLGELANYDFTYNEMQAVRHTAIILIDLIPHYYDTERAIKIKAADNSISEVVIDPAMEDAYRAQQGGKVKKVWFNPKIGKYAVEADIGPTYQTQREEAWEAGKQVIAGAPELMNVIGDLVFLAADWPMADKISERIKRNIEANAPWLLEDGQSQTGPAFKKLNEQMNTTQSQLGEALEKLADARLKIKGHEERAKGKEELRDIEVFDAQTRRLAAEGNAVSDLATIGDTGPIKKLIERTIGQMMGFSLEEIEEANQQSLDEQASQEGGEGAGGANGAKGKRKPAAKKNAPVKPAGAKAGSKLRFSHARRAADGKDYIPDPKRPGKYLLVT